MTDVLIYGGGLLGRQVLYLVKTYFSNDYNVIGFIDDIKKKGEVIEDGFVNYGSLNDIFNDNKYSPDNVKLILAIGYNNMIGKYEAYNNAKENGYNFISLIHPNASIEKNVILGEGVILLAGVVVDQYVEIKDINYLDIGCKIGENTVLDINNYLSAGTTIGGSVNVGKNNFFGLNTTVVNDIEIGNNNFINAMSLIYKKVKDNKRVVMLFEQTYLERQ